MADSILAYIILASLLFSLGILGVIARKNIFIIYMSIELMLNAVNLIFVSMGRYYESMNAQVIAMLIIAVAAAEAAVFLSMIVVLYKQKKSLDSDVFNVLSQKEAL
ncbi:MAG: NADH-quinone oxidoreductase subunit [Sulfurospirillum sp.]|jgi:NADH-quinone oxidoreductase subunit K|nr:NADH-quinone oxidoreductase subunit [Sulfurospirillum sp.]DAB31734.1 MAG TPA: NADH-quinone oxidoreductase subunit NuoK [Sulfurospirillum sp. UBA11407]DAB33378.1 MAG TPA: NADH-quinone oxidoreductase subunit NuoK [Sulfurospirillum sp. UBA12182]